MTEREKEQQPPQRSLTPDDFQQLEQIGFYHNRSRLVDLPSVQRLLAQRGETIDPHQEYTVKGLPLKTPRLEHVPNGFRVHGLVLQDTLKNQEEKQDFLLTHDLPTEHIRAVYPVTEVPDAEENLIPVAVWKQQVLQEIQMQQAGLSHEENYCNVVFETPEQAEEALQFIQANDFISVLREEPLAYRLIDIQDAAAKDGSYFILDTTYTKPHKQFTLYGRSKKGIGAKDLIFSSVEEMEQHLSEILQEIAPPENATPDELEKVYRSLFAQMRQEPQKGSYTSTYFSDQIMQKSLQYFEDHGMIPPDKYHTEDKTSMQEFITTVLPQQMADYLHRLHSYDIAHGFAHGGNWNLAASLVDLDSMHGTPFGDAPATDEKKQSDVQRSLDALDAFLDLASLGGFPSRGGRSSYVAVAFGDNAVLTFREEMICHFLARYLQHEIQSSQPHVDKLFIDSYISHLDFGEEKFTRVDPEKYKEKIKKYIK